MVQAPKLTRRQFALSAFAAGTTSFESARAQSAAAQTVAAAPFILTDQRVLMDVTINGRGPLSFVVDSGANISVIRPERARDLGLKASTTMQVDTGRSLPTDVAEE